MKGVMILLLGCMGINAGAQELHNRMPSEDIKSTAADTMMRKAVHVEQIRYIVESCPGVFIGSYQSAHVPRWYPNQNNPTCLTLDRSAIMNIAATDVRDIVSLAPMVYQRQRGANVLMGGGSEYETLYVVDGMQIAR